MCPDRLPRRGLLPGIILPMIVFSLLAGMAPKGLCARLSSPWLRITPAGRIRCGDLLLATYRGPVSLRPLTIRLGANVFPFFRDEQGRQRAFIAIPLDGRKQRLFFTLTVASKTGTQKSGFGLQAFKRRVPVRIIHLPEKMRHYSKNILARIHREHQTLLGILAGKSPKKLWAGKFMRPVRGKVTSVFGARRKINGNYFSVHHGVDFRAHPGTAVHAINAGKVAFCGNLYLTGKTVVLDHGLGLYSLYAHLRSIAVKTGAPINKGGILGHSGNTGRSTGPHLHLGVTLSGIAVDPLSLLNLSL